MVERLLPTTGKDDVIHKDMTKKSNEFPDYDVLLFHAGRMAETYKAKQAAAHAHTKARNIFKSTGVTIRVFDLVEGICEQEDPKEALDKFVREMMHIAAAFAVVPQGQQVDLFSGAASPLAAKDKAFNDGRARGIMGLGPDDQAYQINSELGQEHLRGWNEGQEVLQQRFLAMNRQVAEEEEVKKAAAEEKAKKKAALVEKLKAKLVVNKTEDGETVQ